MADINRTVGIVFQAQDGGSAAVTGTLSERIDALGLRGMKAADALAILAKNTADADAAAKKAAAGVDELGKSTEGAAKSADGVGTAFRGLQSVLAVLGVSSVVKDFFDANIQFEKTSLTLKAITGDSQSAGKEFEFVRVVANRLGLEVGATADQYAKLIAASKGTQLEGEPTRQIFERIAAAMATLGKSSSETGGVLNAITQIISKGTVQAEELRGQIGDRLPGAFTVAARAIGVTTAELDDLLKSGSVAAGDFLPKFAAELEKTFGGSGQFDTYQAQLARFTNSVDRLYISLGQTGVIDAAGGAVSSLTKFIDTATIGLGVYGDGFKEIARFLRTDMSYAELEERLLRIDRAAQQSVNALDAGLNQSLAETNRLIRQNADVSAAAFASNQTDAETQRLLRQNAVLGDVVKSNKELGDVLKTLGVNPDKFKNDINEIAAALDSLFKNTSKTGDQALAGFEGALKRVRNNDDINVIGGKLTEAFLRGDISARDFEAAVVSLTKTQEKLNKGLKESSDSIDKQAKSAEKAKQAADEYRLKMEQLASNERIKNIEATVSIKVANVEADAKRVIAAFDSINTTITDTGKSIGDLFGLFKDQNLSFQQLSMIRDQIDKENARRDEALRLQRELTQAEIDKIRAQTAAIEKGDALIKIDGAGLQPHLEAFMYEILRTVQVRVNQDGLKLLLGV